MKIAIFGAGQLAMMMIKSDKSNEHQFIVIDPGENPPASHYAEHIKTEYTNKDTLKKISKTCDVATIDFENVDVSSIKFLEDKIPTYPNSEALEICQHRFEEKKFLNAHNISTTEFHFLADESVLSNYDLKEKLKDPTNKYIAKTVRFGYDGKGQSKITQNNLDEFVNKSITTDVKYILERVVDFKSEVSLICVRTRKGKSLFYPLIENHHYEGILRTSRYPNEFKKMQTNAEAIGLKVLDKLNYVGVLVIEFFVDKNNKLIVNEMAPRVHNSGHWTIEGSNFSQFQAHIDAITGKEDLNINKFKPSLMLNILSKHKSVKDLDKNLNNADIYLHDYHKEERKNRKLGHVTVIFNDEESFMKNSENLKI